MTKHTFILTIALLVLLPVVAQAQITPKILGNDQQIKAWVGFGGGEKGSIGPFVSWHDERSDPLIYSAGVRAEYDISDQAWGVLKPVLQLPDSWLEVFAALDAKPYLWGEIGPVNLGANAQAYAGVGPGLMIGPLSIEVGGQLFEGGRVNLDDGRVTSSGLTWFLGLRWKI